MMMLLNRRFWAGLLPNLFTCFSISVFGVCFFIFQCRFIQQANAVKLYEANFPAVYFCYLSQRRRRKILA